MHTTKLRRVGGSVMLAVPPVVLEMLQVNAGTTVGLSIDNGRLIVDPMPRPHYTLEELLAASDYTEPQLPEQREWMVVRAAGAEIL